MPGKCEQQSIFPVMSTGKYAALNSVFLSPITVLHPAMSISYNKLCSSVQVLTRVPHCRAPNPKVWDWAKPLVIADPRVEREPHGNVALCSCDGGDSRTALCDVPDALNTCRKT